MENNLKVPIIIDFFGVPGCGKSTISHELYNDLNKKNYRVIEPTYDLDHNANTYYRKLVKGIYSIIFCMRHPYVSWNMAKKVYQNDYFLFNGFFSQIINLLYKLEIIYGTNSDYIIFDEGIFQTSISLAINTNNKDIVIENCNYIMKSTKRKVVYHHIYIDTDISIVEERLLSRQKKDSRVDAEKNKDKQKELLMENFKLCERLKNNNSIVIDGEKDIGLQVDKILSLLNM